VVESGRIAAIGPGAAGRAARPHALLDARGCAVLPGLVQAHVHLAQTLMRGMADGLPLLAWLRERIWPLEAAHDEASLRVSAEVGLAEALLGGTTALLDMGTVHGHDVVFEACARMGVRATSGKAMMDAGEGVPARLRETSAASLRESDRLRRAFHGGAGGKLRYAFAPRFVLSCTEALIRETAALAAETGCLVHTHAAEHPGERRAVREALGEDDVDALARWGVTGAGAVLVHVVQATHRQVRDIALAGTRVVHCPSANLKLASGIAPVAEMLRAGVVLGIGADGAACNDNLDAWVELRHAALLANLRSGSGSVTGADALELCTIGGARVLGLEREVGSIEVGKRADLVVVSLEGPHQQPGRDVISTLVYATRSRDVRHVLVDGEVLVRDRELRGVDLGRLRAEARRQGARLMRRAGLA
jgi:cytosine/adenosine deaminase-related metal-dependent hydrolase